MTELKYFNNRIEFLDYNDEVIQDNYFVLYSPVIMMTKKEIRVFKLYNLADMDGSNAYCLLMTGNYYIHSFKWNDKLIDKLSKIIEFKNFRNFTFTGQRDLLLQLLDRNKVTYQIKKDRLIYECRRTSNLTNLHGQLELANKSDIDELSEMSYQYSLEEYAGLAHQDYESSRNIVYGGIENKNIFKLVSGGKIRSMAQVLSLYENFPLIGQLYTKNEFRNKGFATSILFHLTNYLLNILGKEKCGLLSDVNNISSNIVFQKVGYQSIYKQISVYKDEEG